MNATDLSQAAFDYDRIENAIKYIETNFHYQPSLKEIADQIGLSEFHFQRLFSRWVGISPKRFLQFLTKEYAKQLLDNSSNILDVTYETGLSSPGRLHDLFVTCGEWAADPLVEQNALLKNNGDGTFSNVAKAAGVEDGPYVSAGTSCLDMDKDDVVSVDIGAISLMILRSDDHCSANTWTPKNKPLRAV